MATVVVLGLLASLCMVIAPAAANAAESVPPFQWSAVVNSVGGWVTSPAGTTTLPCTANDGGRDLMTYNATGQLVQDIPRTQYVDGVTSCIQKPVVDRNGTVYGVSYGQNSKGTWVVGPDLLAYSGNALKWKYPATFCGTGPVVGADGNIYVRVWYDNNAHLIGLKPDLLAGQTVPAKVLDIKINNNCSQILYPYRDGIMLGGFLSDVGNPVFYSYSGKFLGQSTVGGDYREESLNAEGQFFVPQYTWGSYKSASVAMYDPRKGKVVWTSQASTPGANVQTFRLYPITGGGVVALIQEQRMSGGAPVKPTEYVYTIVTFDSNGQKTKAYTLLNQDTNGNQIVQSLFTVDGAGKVAALRNANIVTGGTTVSVVEIGIYDAVNGTWTYQQVMTGDPSGPKGPYGYSVPSADVLALNNDTLLTSVQCGSASCPVPFQTKLFAFKVSGLGMDYPRGVVLASRQLPQPVPQSYVAMGDSYSSGQGAGDYSPSTVSSTNTCYRSNNAYSQILSRDPNVPLRVDSFVACGGSETSVIAGKWTGTNLNEAPQDQALSSSTNVVTITISGNDIGFSDVIKACANPTADCDSAVNLANYNLGILTVNLQSVYIDVVNKAPNAKIYVLGYPPIVTTSGGPACFVAGYPFYDSDRRQKASNLLAALDKAISDNLNTVKSLGVKYAGLRYVDPLSASSPFSGHDICSSDSYFNGLVLPPGDTAESFHPNQKGQLAYATLLLANLTS